MINITLNGKKEELTAQMPVLDLLKLKNIRPEVVTVEHNERILSRENSPRLLSRTRTG